MLWSEKFMVRGKIKKTGLFYWSYRIICGNNAVTINNLQQDINN
jgi:hypothetical protein